MEIAFSAPVYTSATSTDYRPALLLPKVPMLAFDNREDVACRLLESEQEFCNFFENLAASVMHLAADGTVLAVNHRFCKMIGFSREALVGSSFEGLFHTENISNELRQLRRVTQGKIASHEGKWSAFTKNGKEIWVRVAATRSPHGLLLVFEEITSLKDAELALVESERIRVELRRRVLNAQDAERKRIARELHDDIGQSLALLKIQLLRAGTPKVGKSGDLHPGLTSLAATVQAIAQKVSNLSHQLHSPELEFLGLPIAVRSQCRECSDHYHIPVTCMCTGLLENCSGTVGLSFLRVVQEALHNASKYSLARKIKVELVASEKEITLTVSDDGVGFNVERSRKGSGLGLLSMRERMQLIGGDLEVMSEPGEGTIIKAHAPIPKAKKRPLEAQKVNLIKSAPASKSSKLARIR